METLATLARAPSGGRRLRQSCQWLAGLSMIAAALPTLAADPQCSSPSWPLWQRYAEHFVQADGRMLESSVVPDHSTSEGQSYGMLFALIANDPQRFEALWKWTVSNMAGADLDTRLPGWLWGKSKDGQWTLEDLNSASDADLWFAYALLEAARLWQRPDYREDALRLLRSVEKHLVVDLPGLGKMLLPGPVGFVQPDHLWRLNPSYMPLPVLRRLAKEAPDGPWKHIASNTSKLLRASSPKGYAADWVGYRGTSEQSGLFVLDPVSGELGSYDAIRVYLWAGITPKAEPLLAPLLASLGGMADSTGSSGVPPEKVQTVSGTTAGAGPFGFSAALIPYFQAKGQPWLAAQQQRRTEHALEQALTQPAAVGAVPVYYNVMLSLFGLGWAEKRYQFREDGTIKLSWETACSRTDIR